MPGGFIERQVRCDLKSFGRRGARKRLIKRDQLHPELLCQQEVTRIIGRQAGLESELKCIPMIDCGFCDAQPAAQLKSCTECVAQIGMTPAFRETNVGKFEIEKSWGYELGPVERTRHDLGLRFAEQECRNGRRIADLTR